jgi:hypothetical protein
MGPRASRGWLRWAASALGIGGVLLLPAPARAAEIAVRGPHECPDTAELTFRIERLLGMPLIRAAVLHFDVEFAAARGAFAARLLMSGGEEAGAKQRSLQATTCGELGEAVSVAIALALGANAPPPEEAPESPVRETVAAPPAPPSPGASGALTIVAAKPAPPERASFSPALFLGLVFDGGSLPAPGFGVALGVELRADRFALRALGSLALEQHAALPGSGAAGPGADMSLAFGSLAACAAPLGSLRGNLAGSLCAGWELGRLVGTGTGVADPHDGSQLWSAARIDLGLSWALPETALRFGTLLTLAAPFERKDFVLRNLGQVYRPPSLVARAAVGIDVSFQ